MSHQSNTKNTTVLRAIHAASVLLILAILTPSTAHAVTAFQVDIQAVYNGTKPRNLTAIPAGTAVNASIQVNIGPGTPTKAPISGGTGQFTWENDGPQTYHIMGASIGGYGKGGQYVINFPGTGPEIDGIIASFFNVSFNIHDDPFKTSAQLTDLFLDASFMEMRFGAKDGFLTSFDGIDVDITGTITSLSPIPEPATCFLASAALAALATTIPRRRNNTAQHDQDS